MLSFPVVFVSSARESDRNRIYSDDLLESSKKAASSYNREHK